MSQQRFFESRIEALWDRQNQSLNLEAFEQAL